MKNVYLALGCVLFAVFVCVVCYVTGRRSGMDAVRREYAELAVQEKEKHSQHKDSVADTVRSSTDSDVERLLCETSCRGKCVWNPDKNVCL